MNHPPLERFVSRHGGHWVFGAGGYLVFDLADRQWIRFLTGGLNVPYS